MGCRKLSKFIDWTQTGFEELSDRGSGRLVGYSEATAQKGPGATSSPPCLVSAYVGLAFLVVFILQGGTVG